MLQSKHKISEKLIYSGVATTILPFAYGIGLLCIQALEDPFIIKNYGISPKLFHQMCAFILFVGAFLSNMILYSFPKGIYASILAFTLSSIVSVTLKFKYLVDSNALFYCNSLMALSLASLFFAIMVFVSSRYSSSLETRVALSISSMCFALGFAFYNIKKHALCILFSRVFIGFAAGGISKYLPCYLSLISPNEFRSIFSSLYSLGLVGGLLFFYAFLSSCKNFFMNGSWIVPAFFFLYPLLLIFCIPLELKASFDNTLYSLITNPKALKSLLFVSGFHIASNLCGINQLALNPKSIYGENDGFHSAANLFLSLVVSFFVGYLFELLGRKKLTLLSCGILMIGCINFYFKTYVVFSAYLFSFGFNLGMASIPFVILGEIFPEDFISPGAFFGVSCNWIGSALSTIVPQDDMTTPYSLSFIIYFLSTLSFSLCILLFFKETKGKTPCFQ